MTETTQLNAAVAAAALGSEERFRALLRSVVEVARAIFAAKASSILLLDDQSSELVFEAVVGDGEESLLGQRFPAGTGVAGWVLATRTPLVIEDVARLGLTSANQQFPRSPADSAHGLDGVDDQV